MDRDLIVRKLQQLRRYVGELERHRNLDESSLRGSLSAAWAVEHGLQLAIQVVLDVGNHLLASIQENQIEEYVDVLDRMGQRGILSRDLAEQIRDMAGFRNLLVHEYAQVDLAVVADVLRNRLGDFTAFIRGIEAYLTGVRP